MKTGKPLVEAAARAIEASKKTSATAAGSVDPDPGQVDAINQVFALFRLNYHNQYYAAFPDDSQLRQIKKLWLDALSLQRPEIVLRAARRCIEESEYLPTLHRFLSDCRSECAAALGLPDVRQAYREACLAAQPKADQPWSHAAVYHAGREVGWFLLAGSPEKQAMPLFAAAYQRLCDRVMAGEELTDPKPVALPEHSASLPDAKTRRRYLDTLRRATGLDS